MRSTTRTEINGIHKSHPTKTPKFHQRPTYEIGVATSTYLRRNHGNLTLRALNWVVLSLPLLRVKFRITRNSKPACHSDCARVMRRLPSPLHGSYVRKRGETARSRLRVGLFRLKSSNAVIRWSIFLYKDARIDLSENHGLRDYDLVSCKFYVYNLRGVHMHCILRYMNYA